MEVTVAKSQDKQKVIYWRKIVKKFNEGHLSINEFSRQHNISSGKLSYWRLRIPDKAEEKSDFIEIKEADSVAADISISINDVITINFSSPPSPKWISELLSSVKEVA